jgi:hypothetical protein
MTTEFKTNMKISEIINDSLTKYKKMYSIGGLHISKVFECFDKNTFVNIADVTDEDQEIFKMSENYFTDNNMNIVMMENNGYKVEYDDFYEVICGRKDISDVMSTVGMILSIGG